MQANGVLAYFTTLALFFLGWQLRLFSPGRVYDLFGELLAGLNIFSLLFCLGLYFKACLLHILRVNRSCRWGLYRAVPVVHFGGLSARVALCELCHVLSSHAG